MSEENTTQTEETQVNQPSTEASQNNVSDGMIPRTRLNEVNNKYKDSLTQNQNLQAQLDKVKADQETARIAEMEKQGEYKKLLEEANAKLKETSVVVKEYEEYKTNKRTSLMEQITDDNDKSIAESLPLDKLELYVNKINQGNNSLPTNNARATSQQPQGEFGGYDSIQEFAMKDPEGADKYLANNVQGYKWGK